MRRPWVAVAFVAIVSTLAGFLFARAAREPAEPVRRVGQVPKVSTPPPQREVPAEWKVSRWASGHAVHVFNRRLECNECHNPELDTFERPDISVCTNCHAGPTNSPHLGNEIEETDCYTCHSFAWESDAGDTWDCGRCHGSFDTPSHEGLAIHSTFECASCHNPHDPEAETMHECADCHEGLRARHGPPTDPESELCVGCHQGHEPAVFATRCMDCHRAEPPRVSPKAVFTKGHPTCLSCHKPHQFTSKSALRCESCHRRSRALAERRVKEHADCESCHDAHAVRLADDRTCAECHEEVSSDHVAQSRHGDCTSCHLPHPASQKHVAVTCSSCHDEAKSDRTFHAKTLECVSCHKPHTFNVSGAIPGKLCGECHQDQLASAAKNPDHAPCTACHSGTVHEPAGLIACAECHKEIATKSPKGHREACTSCHEPHVGTVGDASCTSCHAIAELPGLHKDEGHADCAPCHSTHEADARADRDSCLSCHEESRDHEPTAKRCTGCHTFRK